MYTRKNLRVNKNSFERARDSGVSKNKQEMLRELLNRTYISTEIGDVSSGL